MISIFHVRNFITYVMISMKNTMIKKNSNCLIHISKNVFEEGESSRTSTKKKRDGWILLKIQVLKQNWKNQKQKQHRYHHIYTYINIYALNSVNTTLNLYINHLFVIECLYIYLYSMFFFLVLGLFRILNVGKQKKNKKSRKDVKWK